MVSWLASLAEAQGGEGAHGGRVSVLSKATRRAEATRVLGNGFPSPRSIWNGRSPRDVADAPFRTGCSPRIGTILAWHTFENQLPN